MARRIPCPVLLSVTLARDRAATRRGTGAPRSRPDHRESGPTSDVRAVSSAIVTAVATVTALLDSVTRAPAGRTARSYVNRRPDACPIAVSASGIVTARRSRLKRRRRLAVRAVSRR